MRYRYSPALAAPLLLGLILSACSSTPPATIPVVTPGKPGNTTAAPVPAAKPSASTQALPAPGAAPASPPAPGLSYRPNQPARQLADGSQVPAVQGLLAASDRALRSGDLELAAVNLERAQRLAPQSAAVYQRLADVRLRQKRPAEAEQLARKALAYTAQMSQQAALWRQIAAARQ
jgi:tetratricopeptide (TPR) repeat protein